MTEELARFSRRAHPICARERHSLTQQPIGKLRRALIALVLGSLASVNPSEALACGGLFCSASNPVSQTAERIIFATDGDGTITCVIEIQYAGPSESFSWVLPVPGEPTISVSSTAAFDRLQAASNPQYNLQTTFVGECGGGFAFGGTGGSANTGGTSSGSGPTVVVVAAGVVGPYVYEVIRVSAGDADPADVAVRWLEDNGYDLPPNGRDTLRPYLADGLNLVGFKLTKQASSGSIRPVVLTYRSDVPFIPIRPTAVAATQDMGILVWVLGPSRAVPVNYRTLELNDALIDWFNPSFTYNRVVIAAANEAGGQGFVTEQSGAAAGFASVIWSEASAEGWVASGTDVRAALSWAAGMYGALDGFVDVVRSVVPLRSTVTPEQFVECVGCYFDGTASTPYAVDGGSDAGESDAGDGTTDPAFDTDLALFWAELEAQVLEPMASTRRLFEDHPYVTRMYTTMSADEMTVDPRFDFNPELADVSNVHTATQSLDCNTDQWKIDLPSGLRVYGSGSSWPLVDAFGDMPANRRIWQLSTTGQGELITDNTVSIASNPPLGSPDNVGRVSSVEGESNGCSCRAPRGHTADGWLGLTLGTALAIAARRRRGSPASLKRH